jgi:hypothetical protein
MKSTLTIANFESAATLLGCSVAAIEAVAEVESSGSGFNPDGTIKVLFEGHHFHKLTKGIYAAAHPTLSYPTWTRAFYGKTQVEEWERVNAARDLDDTAALLSTSFGMFQLMGFNFSPCGASTVQEFFAQLSQSEAAQLSAFCKFILSRGLAVHLRNQDWDAFALPYNGPKYAENRYSEKLAAAYERHLV